MTNRTIFLSLLFVVSLWDSSVSFGQFGGGGGFGGSAPLPQDVKIFPLETISPAEAVKALTQVMSDLDPDSESSVRFAVRPNAKSLVAKGTAEDLKLVQALLMSIDPHPGSETPNKKFAQTLFTITPKHADAGAIEVAIHTVSIPFATYVDHRTNKLLIYGAATEYPRIAELIENLDVPVKDVQNDVMIRFVWLVEKSLASENSPTVPADLSGPIEVLRKKISLGELRTAAQMLVQVNANGSSQFNASGTAELNHAYSITIAGQIANTSSEQYRLQIETNTAELGGGGPNRLTTQCEGIRPGQPVILGTTPINSHASVFVIQILDN